MIMPACTVSDASWRGFNLVEDGCKLRRRDIAVIFLQLGQNAGHDRNPSADFVHESFIHPIQLFQNATDAVDRHLPVFLFRPTDDPIQHITFGWTDRDRTC